MESVECIVIGAGVIGLAVARALALSGRDVVVLEQADAIGTETSSRNSEVIHAGIHYPAGSLKARLCVAGKSMLYDYCAAHHVAHRRCGKLLVATTPAQEEGLAALRRKAEANGVLDLQPLGIAQLKALDLLEPMQAKFQLGDGSVVQLGGFQAISRDKLKALDGDALKALAQTDELELIYIHLQSMQNLDKLIARLQERGNISGTPQAMDGSASEAQETEIAYS